jgi:dTDP-4-amino-4,6-dideoxygalactose transaminase
LRIKLDAAKKNGCLPKVIIVVHFSGEPCDMLAIYGLSQEFNFQIIEDASHAIGGKYQNKLIGSCLYSDITIFSFHPVKIITTGEGGMAVTNSKEYAKKMQLLRSHGITRNEMEMFNSSEGDWYYEQITIGYNYRITDIQAALGISQMRRIDINVARRHNIAACYDNSLKDMPITLPLRHPGNYSALHLYVIRLELNKLNKSRGEIFRRMRMQNIGVNVHYIPVHTQPYYAKFGFKKGDFPNAEDYYESALSLPLFPSMSAAQQDAVIEGLTSLLQESIL